MHVALHLRRCHSWTWLTNATLTRLNTSTLFWKLRKSCLITSDSSSKLSNVNEMHSIWFVKREIDLAQLLLTCRVEYGTPVGRELEKLLKIPINNFNNILTVLQLTDFDPLLDLFDFDGRKAMAVYIANDVLEMQTLIPTEDQVCCTMQL